MRSGLERKVAAYLKQKKVKFKYEPFYVSYFAKINNGYCGNCNTTHSIYYVKRYLIDFLLDNGLFLEVKGKFTPENRTKVLNLLDTSDKITRNNFAILFMRDNWITRKHKSKYSDWCIAHDINYFVSSEGKVPARWIRRKWKK